ncbi:hypothetical protein ABIB25_003843 [Nakamurella sp. UYEF19]|uniref:cellulase family glycosylhydrolase n=1 Tax=Nakamurella sp. UYEF19 TaxID=1756392 RepID=UPI0033960C11
MNWADPRDNFIQDNNVPSGLSATDDYATTFRKSTQILQQFKTVLNANTVRLGINQATVSGSWWASYRGIVDAATKLKMNVILSVWPDRTFMLVEPNAIPTFYDTYQRVISAFGKDANVYLDLVNEPQGYNDDPSGWVAGNPTNWRDVAAGWLQHFSTFPRSRVIIAGTGPGGDWYLGSVGNDQRLDGTLLELHVYSAFGLSFNTYQDWKSWFKGQIAGFESRTIVGEFGTTLNKGANFDGPRDGSNPVSYMYAVTDTIRELGMGSVFWPGYRQGDSWNMLNFTGSGTVAAPYLAHIANPSAYNRLQWAYGLGTPTPISIDSASSVTVVQGSSANFTVRASGYPVPRLSVKKSQLPSGLQFSDLGSGRATISGVPAAGTAGTYHVVVTAKQAKGAALTQTLTVTVLKVAPTPLAGAVTGQITAATTGKPLPKACAAVYPLGQTYSVGRACSSRTGSFEIDAVPAGSYQVFVSGDTPRSASRWYGATVAGSANRDNASTITVDGAGVVTDVSVQLPAAAAAGSVRGAVTDTSTGEKIVGACAFLYSTANPTVVAYKTCSRQNGTFAADKVAAGDYTIAFADPARHYVTSWFNGTDAGAASQAAATAISVSAGSTVVADETLLGVHDPALVSGTGKISGKVVDARTGRPVANAELLVYASPYSLSPQGPKNFTYTRADGSFQVNNAVPGIYIVQLRDARYLPQWFGGTTDPTAAQLLSVVAGGHVRGVDYLANPAH